MDTDLLGPMALLVGFLVVSCAIVATVLTVIDYLVRLPGWAIRRLWRHAHKW